MTAFIMAGALTMGQPTQDVLPDKDATKYIAKALYSELNLKQTVDHIENKYLKLDRYPELIYIGLIGRVALEKRITWEWRF